MTAATTGRDKFFAVLGRAVPVLLLIFIALNPVPYTTAIKEICFYGALGFVLILAGFSKIDFSFRSPLTWPFALFTGWVFIGLFFALDKENSIHDFQTHWLKYLALYYILINVFNTRQRLAWLSWALMVPAALVSLGLIIDFYYLRGLGFSVRLVTGLPEIAVNGLGIVAVPAALFSLHHLMSDHPVPVKALAMACLIVTGTLCFFTQARGTIVALVIGILITGLQNKKILAVVLGGLLVVIAATPMLERFLTASAISGMRLDAHYVTAEIIKDYPIAGIGFGMQTYGNRRFIDLEAYHKRVPEPYRRHLYDDPHSMPFSVAVRTGLVGFGLFLPILLFPFKMVWQTLQKGEERDITQWGLSGLGALGAILIIGLFEPFFSHVPEVVLFTLLAMITVAWKMVQDETER